VTVAESPLGFYVRDFASASEPTKTIKLGRLSSADSSYAWQLQICAKNFLNGSMLDLCGHDGPLCQQVVRQGKNCRG